ncbi:MAG: hypothetical protein HQ582_16230 [Planctomycetes bacterium]|nr:hypothetical protein [Planctomycetota bacterium]
MNMSAAEFSRSRNDRPWLSGRVPNGYWDVRDNRVFYLRWLGQHLGFVRRDDWYRVCNTDFTRNHGGTLIHQVYGSSTYVAMQDYQPQYGWIPWLFSKTPKGFWREAENRKSYMQWLERTLQIGSEEDWYQVTSASFHENRGAGLLQNHFQGSILSALREYRPDYDWKPWLFPKVPHGFWNQPDSRRRYFQWLANRLRFRAWNDWRRLATRDLSATGGGGLFYGYYGGSLARLRAEVVSMKLCERT